MAVKKKSPVRAPVSALGEAKTASLPPDITALFAACEEKLGFVPNVFRAYTLDLDKLRHFRAMYNDLMLGDSPLSPLEREMIAVTVSAVNHCHYCLIAHGAAVRQLSANPALGDTLVANYRAAKLSRRQQAMLDFAHKLTATPEAVVEQDRMILKKVGFSSLAIFHIAAIVGFFSMSNRLATATAMLPNDEYYALGRN